MCRLRIGRPRVALGRMAPRRLPGVRTSISCAFRDGDATHEVCPMAWNSEIPLRFGRTRKHADTLGVQLPLLRRRLEEERERAVRRLDDGKPPSPARCTTRRTAPGANRGAS